MGKWAKGGKREGLTLGQRVRIKGGNKAEGLRVGEKG